MTPSIRKLMLTIHVAASVGWLGALAVFFAHALASVLTESEEVVRAAALAMGLTAWLVIMPLSIASLVTGLVQALMQPISHLADAAAQPGFSSGELTGLRVSLTVHAAGGLAVLLTALVLAIYKPAALTRLGRRAAGVTAMGTPRWSKILGLILASLVMLVAVMALFGAHGPGAHYALTLPPLQGSSFDLTDKG